MSMMVTFKVSWWEEVCPLWAPIPIRPLIVRALILSYPLGTLSALAQDCFLSGSFSMGGGRHSRVVGWGEKRAFRAKQALLYYVYIFQGLIF